tara:strand:+ start:4900 stop:5928 length:1029 start_codon:yes stop_codon:yes gene_type:complete
MTMDDKKEYKEIIDRFPSLELSYDYVDHTKASKYDYYMAIPYGKKYFMWFTYYNKKRTCFLLNMDRENNIQHIESILTINNDDLHYGTILYGTMINHENHRYYVMQDMYMYKGEITSNFKNYQKMNIFMNLFKHEIQQEIYLENQVVISLPVMDYKYTNIIEQCKKLVYDIYDIQCWNKQYHKPVFISYRERRNQVGTSDKIIHRATFNVTADVQNDIYNLHCFNEGNFNHYYDIAYIPSYKISVYMNSLFRNIKENENLDALEESDDEDEFEDVREDKYVDLNLQVKMDCIYNSKFKKWVPLKISQNKLSSIVDIKNIFQGNKYDNNAQRVRFRKFKKKKY